ncbi:MAG: SGNH/GDSL hydrolase family protein [Clostridiales bacterium]|nr:SGNH/GDSL hydrolase family protein [Clostridiales bacterium]
MKKVLLIGDSIRMSYNARVAQLLEGKADVWGPDENCRFAKYTLWEIGGWLNMGGGGKPDIIHWNNGIWDVFRINGRVDPFTSLDEYLRDMDLIYNEMALTGAKIIFATTTPVGAGFSSADNKRIDTYNAAITRHMDSLNVPVNDLNKLVSTDIEGFLCGDLLHLSDKGVEAVSCRVAEFIERCL